MAVTTYAADSNNFPANGLKVRTSAGFFENITTALSAPFMDEHAAEKKVVQWTAWIWFALGGAIGWFVCKHIMRKGRESSLAFG